jgi:predicted Zn-dependent protease
MLLAAVLYAPPAFARKKNGSDDIGKSYPAKGLNFYSIEREIALGREMALEVERESRLFNDTVISEYVNRLGQNLVRNSDAKVPFTIKVIDSEEINAFALPGGFMFVNTGLISKAEGEAELVRSRTWRRAMAPNRPPMRRFWITPLFR